MQKLKMLETWKRLYGSEATYLLLVEACFKVDRPVAEYIIEYVKKNGSLLISKNDYVKQNYLECITNIAKSFNKCNIGVDKVKYALITCCCIPDDEVVPVDSLQGLFAVVQRNCSWFNHQPLEMLLNNLECDKEKAMLSEYQNSVSEPYLVQPIFEVPFSSFGSEAASLQMHLLLMCKRGCGL